MTNLQKIRMSKDCSQSMLAAKAGISLRSLQEYEQGRRDIDLAKLRVLMDLSNALECKLYEILEDPELIDKVRQAVK